MVDVFIPYDEVEAAADALRILWNSDKNQAALQETGHGASWALMARTALAAAKTVRGRCVAPAPEGMQ